MRHNAAENGLNSVKTKLASQSMRHHLYFSRLSRPENGRKTSLVYDVEVCIVLHQDFRCMSLGCSRLLRSWRTPHQCFLHQLYNICVLQFMHTKKAGIFTCSDRDHNSEKNYTTATLSTLFPPSTWPLPMRGESFGHWPTESNFFFLQQKRLDSASQCPNDSPRTLPSKETHTSV